jgi:exodeoxyribonuclease VII large subunit
MDFIRRRQQRVDDVVNRLAHSQRSVFEIQRRRFEILSAAVRHYDARRMLTGIGKELDAHLAAMNAATRALLLQRKSRLERLSSQLEALSPLAILERGYALVFDASGKLVKDASQLSAGDEISGTVARGSFAATIKNTE